MEVTVSEVPKAIEAERVVLGAILRFPDCAPDVFRKLGCPDFFDAAHRAVYNAMLGQHARGLAVDPIAMNIELKGHREFLDGSPAGFMLELADSVATSANLDYYIKLVKDARAKRQIQCFADSAFRRARNGHSADEILHVLRADIDDLTREKSEGVVCAADVKPEPINWLWPNRIAIGKVTLLAGDPGLGKSLATIAMATAVSRGAPWPDAPCVAQNAGGVILLSAEDDLADTIRPRLDAHGADVSRIFALTALEDLARDIDRLRDAIDRVGDCRLVVIDPISAYMGHADSHVNAEVRAVLTPLAELAAEKRVAILAVTHLRKGEGAAMYRAMGSLAFIAAARAGWAIVRDKHDARRRLMLAVKNNLAADIATGMAFRIEPLGALGAPVVCWETEPVTITADEALAPEPNRRGRPAEEREDAAGWLQRALSDGPRPARDVEDEACQVACISRSTLKRARQELGIVAYRPSNPGPWWWRLPGGGRVPEP